jgi:hypothetical protein
LSSNKNSQEIDQICIKCGRAIAYHPTTGRFDTIILYGRECAWNPDKEFRGFVMNTLKSAGYNLEDFGYLQNKEWYNHRNYRLS